MSMREKLPHIVLWVIIGSFAVAGILICIFTLPSFGTAVAKHFPEYAFWQYPILTGLYSAAACFFFALFQFWLLLHGIVRDGIVSVVKLKIIRFSAIIFSVLYFLSAMPVIFLAAQADDAPGLVLLGALVVAFPVGAAAVAAILERLFEE